MFTRSIKLFELFGFSVKVDASWLLLAVLISWSLAVGYFPSVAPGFSTSTYWSMGIVGLIGLAFSIVIHELAHSLVARRFNMPIRGITLFIFGGVAEMEEEPTSARGELWMALAGPAMSIAVAIVFYILASLAAIGSGAEGATDLSALPPIAIVLSYLAGLNLILAVFNMVPAFPLDGGRVLRALLWGWRGDIIWATRVAAGAGSLFGILLIVLGLVSFVSGNLVGGVWWFILGLFVRGAAQSAVYSQVTRSILSDQPVSRFMRRDLVTVDPSLPLDRLVEDYFYRHYYKSFPVVEHGRLVGCVAVDQVKATDPALWRQQTVRSIMEDCGEDNTVSPTTGANRALAQMMRTGRGRLLVTDGGRLVGVLALRDLMDYLSVRLDLPVGEQVTPDRLRHMT